MEDQNEKLLDQIIGQLVAWSSIVKLLPQRQHGGTIELSSFILNTQQAETLFADTKSFLDKAKALIEEKILKPENIQSSVVLKFFTVPGPGGARELRLGVALAP